MTATETEARIEEAFRFMGPVLGRQQSELLRPLIDRVFEIMDRKGMIDEAPEVLQNQKFPHWFPVEDLSLKFLF